MSIDIPKIRKSTVFEDNKIKIVFLRGDVTDSLSVYMKDAYGKEHHILWEISPDRCNQNFDKTNEKIKNFVKSKITEWEKKEEEAEKLREKTKKEQEQRKEKELQELIDGF